MDCGREGDGVHGACPVPPSPRVTAGPEVRRCRLPHVGGAGTAFIVCYWLTQPIEPTGKLLPVDVAVNPKVTLPSGGTVRL